MIWPILGLENMRYTSIWIVWLRLDNERMPGSFNDFFCVDMACVVNGQRKKQGLLLERGPTYWPTTSTWTEEEGTFLNSTQLLDLLQFIPRTIYIYTIVSLQWLFHAHLVPISLGSLLGWHDVSLAAMQQLNECYTFYGGYGLTLSKCM